MSQQQAELEWQQWERYKQLQEELTQIIKELKAMGLNVNRCWEEANES